MTNAYYHEFSVGFNLWYIMVPVMLLGMFMIGYLNVKRFRGYIRRKSGAREQVWLIDRRMFTDYLYIFFGAITTLAFAALFIDESMLGCIQVLDNIGISIEDGAWSPLFAFGLVLPCLCFLYAVLAYGAACLGEHVRAAVIASTIEDFLGKDASRTAHNKYFEGIRKQHERREAFAAKIEGYFSKFGDVLESFFGKIEKAIY